MKVQKSIFDANLRTLPFDWGGALLIALLLHAFVVIGGLWMTKHISPTSEKPLTILLSTNASTSTTNQNLEVDLVNLTASTDTNVNFQVPVEQPDEVPEPLLGENLPDPTIPTSTPITPDPGLLTADNGRPPIPIVPTALPTPSDIPSPVPMLINSADNSETSTIDNAITIGNKNFPKPPYPYAAVAEHMEGTVILFISIEAGKIIKTTVSKSSGYGILDRAAANWISKNWRFAENVTGTVAQPIQFQLN